MFRFLHYYQTTITRVLLTVILALLVVTVLIQSRSSALEQKQITIIFRYDDYSGASSTDIDIRVLNVFERHKIPLTVGVIPQIYTDRDIKAKYMELSSQKVAVLKRHLVSKGVEVALHGYSHQAINRVDGHSKTEFSGVPLTIQQQKIEKGKKYLEQVFGVKIFTFIPPWNSYDNNTLRILERSGFTTLSAGLTGTIDGDTFLKFIPSMCSLGNVKSAIEEAQGCSDKKPIIVVLLHDYDFNNQSQGVTKYSYEHLSRTLEEISAMKHIQMSTIRGLAETQDDTSVDRYLLNSNVASSPQYRLMPSFLTQFFTANVYYSDRKDLQLVSLRGWVMLTIFYLLVVLSMTIASYVFDYTVLLKSLKTRLVLQRTWLVLVIALLIFVLRDRDINFNGAMAIIACLSFGLGMLISNICGRK